MILQWIHWINQGRLFISFVICSNLKVMKFSDFMWPVMEEWCFMDLLRQITDLLLDYLNLK